MNEPRPPKLFRRQEKMASMMRQVLTAMEHSIKTGRPCFHTPEMQSLIGHFEADRVRVAQFVAEAQDRKTVVRNAMLDALKATRAGQSEHFSNVSHSELGQFVEAVLEAADVLP